MRDPGDLGIGDRLRTLGFDELVEMGSVIVGSPRTVRDRLVDIATRFRIGNLHTTLQFGSMPRQVASGNITLFASEVMPTLRSVWDNEQWEHHWWPERLGGRPHDVESGVGVGVTRSAQ
jgi:hypothetical protein